jgi:hypothetical protein
MGGWAECPAVRTRERGPPSASVEILLNEDFHAFLASIHEQSSYHTFHIQMFLLNDDFKYFFLDHSSQFCFFSLISGFW